MWIEDEEISVRGKLFRVARLRHEWCKFPDEPEALVKNIKASKSADLFTFLQEIHPACPELPFHQETFKISLLTIKSFDTWWENLHFKARNKARKAQKAGVEIRQTKLDVDFVRGVERIYNESPLRQGRKFTHFGETFSTIKSDLSSFASKTIFIGAYFNKELIGFMKLFEGTGILRIVHIIATFADRDKCVMDALIAQAVKICDEKNIHLLHYGDWASRGLGVFRIKYNFQPHDCPRYFVPLTMRGKLMLGLQLHRPLRERLPKSLAERLIAVRNHWNAVRYGVTDRTAET